jgi:hypothetical protein
MNLNMEQEMQSQENVYGDGPAASDQYSEK